MKRKHHNSQILWVVLIWIGWLAHQGLAGSPTIPSPQTNENTEPAVQLIKPIHGEKTISSSMMFEWQLSQNLKKTKKMTYSLKLVEITDSQGPFTALTFNPPVVEKSGIVETNWTMPDDITLGPQKSYAWQITAFRKGNPIGKSDVLTFGAESYQKEMTRQEATNIIVHTIITPPTLAHNVSAFLVKEQLRPEDNIWPFSLEENKTTPERNAWFAWLNDDPQAFFSHPTRFVFLDVLTGEIKITDEEWWPVLNGESLFMDDTAWQDADMVIYSDVHLKNK